MDWIVTREVLAEVEWDVGWVVSWYNQLTETVAIEWFSGCGGVTWE